MRPELDFCLVGPPGMTRVERERCTFIFREAMVAQLGGELELYEQWRAWQEASIETSDLPVSSRTSAQQEALDRWERAYQVARSLALQGVPYPDVEFDIVAA